MRQDTQRQRRVGKLIQEIVAEILQKDVDDPDVGFVTVTGADVSADLRNANVYFSVLGDEEQIARSRTCLLRAKRFINLKLGEKIDLKYTPKLYFKLDETAQEAQKMQNVLREVENELSKFDELHPEDDEDDESADW